MKIMVKGYLQKNETGYDQVEERVGKETLIAF
jgi:hypothetical protein